jgi:hypothetical protein
MEIYDYIEETKYLSARLLTSAHAELVPVTNIPELGSVAKLSEIGRIPTTGALSIRAGAVGHIKTKVRKSVTTKIRVTVQRVKSLLEICSRAAAVAKV